MNKIGIMQGRLTEPRGRGIQFFPFENWENEFFTARELGLDEIEFIFDYENYGKNPLWTIAGQSRVAAAIKASGISVNSVCFDYFMRRPFYKAASEEERGLLKSENRKFLIRIINAADIVGFHLIEIPLVDSSSIKTVEEEDAFRDFILEVIDETKTKIKVGLETDFEPRKFLEYLNSFQCGTIFANYDSGNSSGLGYNQIEEVTILNQHITNIHIKDRVYRGTTVALGTGNADFEGLFQIIGKIDYKGSFILQAARGAEGEEKENIKNQIDFLNSFIKRL